MKIRLYNNRYLQFFAEAGEKISVEQSTDELAPTVSLDLQDVIGIEGAKGDQGVQGPEGKSAKDILIDANVLDAGATDDDFYDVLKGADGVNGTNGVSVTNVEVLGTQNTTVNRVDCVDGICKIQEGATATKGAVKTTVKFTLSNGTYKTVEILSEDGNDLVAMNETDFEAYFGESFDTTGTGIQSYTQNDTTIYVVPIEQLIPAEEELSAES